MQRKVLVGTSGWMYKDWDKNFYPHELRDREKLNYISRQFKTVEVNTSFYHFPTAKTFEKWRKQTEKSFVFAVKINRRYTHIKRLILDEEIMQSINQFLISSSKLKEKLGVYLIQLPQSAKANFDRLNQFLHFWKVRMDKLKIDAKLTIEFRHESWFVEETYKILTKYNVALVIADSQKYPKVIQHTADFVYIRLHGPQELFTGNYPSEQLKEYVSLINNFPNKIKTVFVYFNNDIGGYAADNALFMQRELEKNFQKNKTIVKT